LSPEVVKESGGRFNPPHPDPLPPGEREETLGDKRVNSLPIDGGGQALQRRVKVGVEKMANIP